MLPQGPPPPFPPLRVLSEDDLEMIVARITQSVMNLLAPREVHRNAQGMAEDPGPEILEMELDPPPQVGQEPEPVIPEPMPGAELNRMAKQWRLNQFDGQISLVRHRFLSIPCS